MDEHTKLLTVKEQRAAFQKSLLTTPEDVLLVIKANYPGANKFNPFTYFTVFQIYLDLLPSLSIISKYTLHEEEGYIIILKLKNDARKLKYQMIKLEQTHPLGRLIDLDVHDIYKTYSRKDFNLSPRKCYLCNDIAHLCVRSNKHSHSDLIRFFHQKVLLEVRKTTKQKVLFSLLGELSLHPKFGLVTPFSAGSHLDMDVNTFETSILSFVDDFQLVETIDFDLSTNEIFYALREIGLAMEKKMFLATNKINTHKGAIFLFLMYLCGKQLAQKNKLNINQAIKELSLPLVEELKLIKTKSNLTFGESWYLNSNQLGVKQIVIDGFGFIFDDIFPYFNYLISQNYNFDQVLKKTLLKIMSLLDDTTIIKRGGINSLIDVKNKAQALIDSDENKWNEFSLDMINRCLSPGGSADILSIIIYLWLDQKGEENYEN